MKAARLWLCLPAVLLAILDHALTLAGQSSEYWSGDYEAAQEANPLARPFLVWSPYAFLGIGLAWVLSFSSAILWLPRSAAIVASFLVTFSHAVGSSTWLWRFGPVGIILTVVVFVAAERLVDLSWKRMDR